MTRDILIYGPIEPGMARGIVDEIDHLAQSKGDIHVRINSPGGDVAEGIAIFNALRKYSDRVVATVEGVAYSMASVIALAGRETRAFELAQFMVHDPRMAAQGTRRDMQAAVGALDAATHTLLGAYTRKTSRGEAEIRALMDKTTFMSASEAKELGFVDVVLGDRAVPMAASFDTGAWAAYHAGTGPMPTPVAVDAQGEAVAPAAATIAELRAAVPGASDAFIVKALENGWTAVQAQAEELAAVRTELATLKAKGPAAVTGPGVEALSTGVTDTFEGDPVVAFNEAVAARVAKGMNRARAVADVYRNERGVYDAFLEVSNVHA